MKRPAGRSFQAGRSATDGTTSLAGKSVACGITSSTGRSTTDGTTSLVGRTTACGTTYPARRSAAGGSSFPAGSQGGERPSESFPEASRRVLFPLLPLILPAPEPSFPAPEASCVRAVTRGVNFSRARSPRPPPRRLDRFSAAEAPPCAAEALRPPRGPPTPVGQAEPLALRLVAPRRG